MSSMEHRKHYGEIPEIELPDEQKQVRRKLSAALCHFWNLGTVDAPGKKLVWAKIAPVVAVVEQGLSNDSFETWISEPFLETQDWDSRIDRFVTTFIPLHQNRLEKNRLLTIVMALLSSSETSISAARKVTITGAVLDALGNEAFKEASVDFLEIAETPSFLTDDREVGSNLLQVVSTTVGELYGKRSTLEMEDILAAIKWPVCWAKQELTCFASHSEELLWSNAIEMFVKALARTEKGLRFLAKDIGHRNAEQQLFWPREGFPETLFFDELSSERKGYFLKVVLDGSHQDEYGMFQMGTNYVRDLTQEEFTSGDFDAVFPQLCSLFCQRRTWVEGNYYQGILERALKIAPAQTASTFLEYLQKELDHLQEALKGSIPEDEEARRIGELEHLCNYLKLVVVPPESPPWRIFLVEAACLKITAVVGKYHKTSKAMDLVLAKIAYLHHRKDGSNDYLIARALSGVSHSRQIAETLGRKYFPEMSNSVVELAISKIAPIPVPHLQILAACGANACDLLNVEKTVELRRAEQAASAGK